MKSIFLGLLAAQLSLFGQALQPTAIPAGPAQAQTVKGHVPEAVARLTPQARFAATNRLNLAIGLPLRNKEALTNLLRDVIDPASPNYRHYLTPEQFAERFGPTEQDYEAVQAFFKAKGFSITATHPNRLLVDVSGSVADIEQSCHLTMRVYKHPTEDRTFYAPDTEPSLDLGVPLAHIGGLDNFSLPRPRLKATPLNNVTGPKETSLLAPPLSSEAERAVAAPNTGSAPNGGYMGYDLRTAYVPDTTLTGAGQSVGILQFDGYNATDIAYYVSKAGLPSVPLVNVLIDGASGLPSGSGGEVEVCLDIEMAISMAPGLSNVMVYMAPNPSPWEDILNRMANDNKAKQLSCSWYRPRGAANPTTDAIFQQMALQGQSFFNASGDYDAYTGLIDFPGDTPYITQVGGATLSTLGAGGAYASEIVWNRHNGIGSGGGISTQYPIPAFQTNVNMAACQGSGTMRNIPDVALIAESVYVRADGRDYAVGGTSCSAPGWAGFAALVNQQAAASGQPYIGFANPALYALGTGPTYSACFHDITVGDNTSPGSPAKFYSFPGYDLCTGWGTPRGQALINALANPEPLLIKPDTGFTSIGGVGGPFSIPSLSFTLTNTGTNTLSWSLVNTSAWLSVSVTSGTLTPGGPAGVVTIGLNTTASNLALGTYAGTVAFTNLNDGYGQNRDFTLRVISPPTITAQPTNQSVPDGGSAIFSAQVTGGDPLYYQWSLNGTSLVDGGNLFGANTATLTITNASQANVGGYTLLVTNFAGSTVSSNATLAIPPSPPVIVAQPIDQTVYVGATVQFSVAALGNKPFYYQWNSNTTNLPGATNATLVLTNLQISQSGNYWVTVSNSYGSTNSAMAVLTVNPPPPCFPIASGMVSWWAGEGTANDSVGMNNGTMVNGATFAPGLVHQAFSLNGTGAYVSMPNSATLVSCVTNITVELWLKNNFLTNNPDWTWIVAKGNSSWRMMGTTGGRSATFSLSGVSAGDVMGVRNINDGQWHHVAGVYDGTNVYLYVDGTLDVSKPGTGFIAQNSYGATIGHNLEAPRRYFNGLLDEVTLYNRALSPAEIQGIYITGIGGKCPLPLTITGQPTNGVVNAGDTAVFTVTATGPQPISYQWYFNSTNLTGATNNILVISNAQPANAGTYWVAVANPNTSLNSSNATLTVVTHPPRITSQPVNQTNYVGSTVSFSVTADGTAPLFYQWVFNTTNLPGATNSTLVLNSVQPSQAGNYWVQVTNAYGVTNSSVAVLTVNPPPACYPVPFSVQSWWPGNGTADDSIGTNNGAMMNGATFGSGLVGQAFSLNGAGAYVSIPDSPTLDSFVTNVTIELWLKGNVLGNNSDWTWIIAKGNSSWRMMGTTGGNTATFSLAGVTAGDVVGSRNINDGQWHHVAGVYDGTNVSLYVDGTLDVSKPGTGLIAQNGYAAAIGNNLEAPRNYFDGLIDEVSIYNRALRAADIYGIYATGSGGKCPLAPSAPIITGQPASQTVYIAGTANFSVTADGTPPLTYQWNFNTTNLTGATNPVLVLTNVQLGQAGNYSVLVSNAYGSTTSAVAVLTVNPAPPCFPAPSGIVSWWPGEGSTLDTIGTNNGVLVNGAAYAAGKVGQAFSLSGASQYVQMANSPSLNSCVSNITIELWLKGNVLANNSDWTWIIAKGNSSWRLMGTTGAKTATLGLAGINDLYGARNINDGQWHHVAGVYDGTNMFLYVDGTLDVSQHATGLIAQNTYAATIGNNLEAPRNYYNGLVDEVTIYNRALSAAEIQGIYAADTRGKCPVPPSITLQPASQTNVAGGSVTFKVAATGYKPLGYQWRKNSTNIVGATATNLTLVGLKTSDMGFYSVTVSNAGGMVVSSDAALTVLGAPIILTQPQSQQVLQGSNVTFGVVALGAPAPTCRWMFKNRTLTWATNASFTLTNISWPQSGNYSVVVSNVYGWVVSSNATLTVLGPPFITQQPASQLVLPGCSVVFSVAAGSAAPVSYQWSKDGEALPYETNSYLPLASVMTTDFGAYQVALSNAFGVTLSAPATLGIDHLPIPSSDTIQRYAWAGTRVKTSALLANDTDEDGDPLTLTSVSPLSVNGGTVVLSNNWVYYAPPAGSTNVDYFSYTVSDGNCGGTSSGTVVVQVRSDMAVAATMQIARPGDGSVHISFDGVPGTNYRIQYTDSLSAPAWQDLWSGPADIYGTFELIDSPPPSAPARLYRCVSP